MFIKEAPAALEIEPMSLKTWGLYSGTWEYTSSRSLCHLSWASFQNVKCYSRKLWIRQAEQRWFSLDQMELRRGKNGTPLFPTTLPVPYSHILGGSEQDTGSKDTCLWSQGQVCSGPASPLCLAAPVLADLPRRLYVGLSLRRHCRQYTPSGEREAKRGV